MLRVALLVLLWAIFCVVCCGYAWCCCLPSCQLIGTLGVPPPGRLAVGPRAAGGAVEMFGVAWFVSLLSVVLSVLMSGVVIMCCQSHGVSSVVLVVG